MRVILVGQAAFAERVLDGLRDHAHEVVAVYCPPERPGTRADPVRARADTLGIPVRQHRSLRGPDVQAEFAAWRADLGVLAYVTQIVPAAVIDAPRLGSICFHPSLLPRYRGGSAIPWQIIRGETRTGVTVFWTDAGIDTGPILLQKEAVIGPDDTAGSLYYQTLLPLGIEAVVEAVDRIAAGTAARIPQDDAQATYDPLCTDEHACIDWSRPTSEVYNLIRGCDPQPGAYVARGAEKVRCYDARLAPRTASPPGIIAEIGPEGLVIGAGGGALRIGRLKVGDRKAAAHELAASLGLSPGARF
jgi:methionyl-tRNA formyltransferase